MTATAPVPPAPPVPASRSGTASKLRRIFSLILRMQLTRARLLGLLGLGAVVVLIGVAVRADSSPAGTTSDMFDVIDGFGLAVLGPVVALVFATAALGDFVDDRTLVYVWLRPVPRWQIVTGALGASLAAAVPIAVVPVVVAVLIGGGGRQLAVAAGVATALAVVGYSTLFLGLGFKVQRALVWGLAYLAIWEGAVARAASGAARLSIQVYARSVFAELADFPAPNQASTTTGAFIAIAAIVIGAWCLTVRWLTTTEVA